MVSATPGPRHPLLGGYNKAEFKSHTFAVLTKSRSFILILRSARFCLPSSRLEGIMADPALTAATKTIETAFKLFRHTVSPQDTRLFDSTDLQDVWQAVRRTERTLATIDQSRALRRIEPFLSALGHYSKPIEVLCNGTPYLPWIWVGTRPALPRFQTHRGQAPVKLLLQVTQSTALPRCRKRSLTVKP